jgi:thiamine biosynthesis lipoprotein
VLRDGLQISREEWLKVHNIHHFSHAAMATIFEIFIAHENKNYASQAAHAAFVELDRLEQELSRFIENSDISRINNLSKHQSIIIGMDALTCLQACKILYHETQGAFDVSVGPLIKLWRKRDQYTKEDLELQANLLHGKIGLTNLEISEEKHEVRLMSESIQIDLGGYGKGYAVDKMADILTDWSIEQTLIHGGKSTVLALNAPPGEQGWKVTMSNPRDYSHVIESRFLKYQALSGSGLQKGSHIINPHTGFPVENKIAAWAGVRSAALSDALSTSFMIMSQREIEAYVLAHEDITALIILHPNKESDQDYKVLRFDSD